MAYIFVREMTKKKLLEFKGKKYESRAEKYFIPVLSVLNKNKSRKKKPVVPVH